MAWTPRNSSPAFVCPCPRRRRPRHFLGCRRHRWLPLPHPERTDPNGERMAANTSNVGEAEVGSYNTTLGLVNLSGTDIKSTAVTIDHTSDWDNDKWRPDVNFTGALADSHSR